MRRGSRAPSYRRAKSRRIVQSARCAMMQATTECDVCGNSKGPCTPGLHVEYHAGPSRICTECSALGARARADHSDQKSCMLMPYLVLLSLATRRTAHLETSGAKEGGERLEHLLLLRRRRLRDGVPALHTHCSPSAEHESAPSTRRARPLRRYHRASKLQHPHCCEHTAARIAQ